MGYKKKIEDPDESPQSPSTRQKGNWGEQVAVDFLVSQGYAITERQWKMGHYEVDIIAQTAQRIHFVEVKTRSDAAYDPASSVTRAKQRRIITSADAYLRKFDIPFDYQFDVVCVVGNESNCRVEFIPDAYFPRPK